MLIGYMRVSSSDERQSVALQRDALLAAGVDERHLHQDRASGARDDRPGLKACLGELREGDVLVVWKIDRLGRSLSHLIRIGVTTRKWRICPTFKNVSGTQVGLTVDVVAFSALRAS